MMPFYEVRDESLFVGEICRIPYPLHVHKVVEFVHLQEGTISMTIGTRRWDLQAGDTAIVFPSIPHSYDILSDDARGLCAIFLPDTIAEHAPTFACMHPVSPLLPASAHSAVMMDAAARLAEAASEEKSPMLLAYLHLFTSCLLTSIELSDACSFDGSLMKKVLDYVAAHCLEDITLASTAKELGISTSHLSHFFSSQMNVNFRWFVNNLRIDNALRLLRDTNLTVTEIAYQSGYMNPRTFHRAFRTERGIGPGEYREMYRAALLEKKC